MDTFLSRFAFIFLIYAVITSGYIDEILSCQMRKFLQESKYFRHFLGIILVFVFIMLEGGWSWDSKLDDEADNDWSSGNVLHTLSIALLIYVVFIISSKSQLVPNLVFIGIVFVVYLINTQRNYYRKRNMISEEQNERLVQLSRVLFVVAVITLVYGFIDYVQYQKWNYGSQFRWEKFLLGVMACSNVPK